MKGYKPIGSFNNCRSCGRRYKRDHRLLSCKECRAKKTKERHNSDEYRESRREYYAENRDSILARQKQWKAKPEVAKKEAKRRGKRSFKKRIREYNARYYREVTKPKKEAAKAAARAEAKQ